MAACLEKAMLVLYLRCWVFLQLILLGFVEASVKVREVIGLLMLMIRRMCLFQSFLMITLLKEQANDVELFVHDYLMVLLAFIAHGKRRLRTPGLVFIQ